VPGGKKPAGTMSLYKLKQQQQLQQQQLFQQQLYQQHNQHVILQQQQILMQQKQQQQAPALMMLANSSIDDNFNIINLGNDHSKENDKINEILSFNVGADSLLLSGREFGELRRMDSTEEGANLLLQITPHAHSSTLNNELATQPLPPLPPNDERIVPFSGLGINTQLRELMGPPSALKDSYFPQPSPAACGKRKRAELQAAQMLAASSSSSSSTFVNFKTRNDKEQSPSDHGLSLEIPQSNEPSPDNFQNSSSNIPGTPWDSSLKALANKSKTQIYSFSVSTPSDQKNFFNKVRSFVLAADISGLIEILKAADISYSQTNISESEMESSISMRPSILFNSPDPKKYFKNEILSDDHNNIDDSEDIISSKIESSKKNIKDSYNFIASSLNKLDRTEQSKSILMEAITLELNSINQSVILQLCSILIDYGVSTHIIENSSGNSCLHFAARKGYEKVGKLLLSKGCPLNNQNFNDGDTAAHIAAKLGNVPFLLMLADLGANFHLRNNISSSALDLIGSGVGSSILDSAARETMRRELLLAEPRLRTLVLFHEDCLEHGIGRPNDWEGPGRLVGIMRRMRDQTEFQTYEMEISSQFEKAGIELLQRAHSPDYITFVNSLSKQISEADSDNESPGVNNLSVPFTPQVQKFLMQKTFEEVKQSELCDTFFSAGTLNAARRSAGIFYFKSLNKNIILN
jgi:hypothetical protein